jgi:hypothetical protein
MRRAVERVDEPYLSVVVTARNDDHGGNPLQRMQMFIDSLLEQCDRHRLPSELVIVEWNPPDDRPRLGDALRWPRTAGYCTVRIIEVPNDLHARLAHAESLPLFQMIAKNVGIRRSRGEFVLVTNIDLLFDDRLVRRLAARRLRPERLYRVDRYDVPAAIDGPFDQRLAWCRGSVMRIHTAHGSMDVGTGVFYPIGRRPRLSQKVRNAVNRRPDLALRLRAVQARADEILDRTQLRQTSAEAARHARQGGTLAGRAAAYAVLVVHEVVLSIRGLWYYTGQGVLLIRDAFWLLRAFAYWFWCGIREPRLVPRRAFRRLRRIEAALRARVRASRSRATGVEAVSGRREGRATQREWLQGLLATWHVRRSMPPLHTNACGDFTLMSRADWDRTRAYPELQRFSMHIDGLFLYQAHHAGIREQLLPYPIFHIEHGAGFRPDASARRELDQRLERDGISQISNTEFLEWVVEMRATAGPLDFNTDDWGFRGETLPEYDPMREKALMAS